MTLKAIYFDRRVDMALGTKMFATFYAGRLTAIRWVGGRVTFEAATQAILLGANAIMHGLFPLMLEQCHVVAAHEVRVLDTLLPKRHVLVVLVAIGNRTSDAN